MRDDTGRPKRTYRIKQGQNGKWDCIGLMGLAELYRSNRGQSGLYWTKRIYGSMYRTKRANRIIQDHSDRWD
jgi:hypothetical protein